MKKFEYLRLLVVISTIFGWVQCAIAQRCKNNDQRVEKVAGALIYRACCPIGTTLNVKKADPEQTLQITCEKFGFKPKIVSKTCPAGYHGPIMGYPSIGFNRHCCPNGMRLASGNLCTGVIETKEAKELTIIDRSEL